MISRVSLASRVSLVSREMRAHRLPRAETPRLRRVLRTADLTATGASRQLLQTLQTMNRRSRSAY